MAHAPPRLAILGAGPVGLEAALQALRRNFAVSIFERGEAGEHLRHWGHVRMFSPFGMNSTPLGLAAIRAEHVGHELPGPTDLLTGGEYRDAYLNPLALTETLGGCLKSQCEVLAVGRDGLTRRDPPEDPRRKEAPFRLLYRDASKAEQLETFDLIFDCTGTQGRHAWAGSGGLPAVGEMAAEKQIAYHLEDILGNRRNHYSGRTVAVIGAGYSAATAVQALTQLGEENQATWVIWLARGTGSHPLPRLANDPLKERDRLAVKVNGLAARGEGNLEFHAHSLVDAIVPLGNDRGFRLEARCRGKAMTWEVDRVVAQVGNIPTLAFCRELHVEESDLDGSGMTREPGYFVLGQKSIGRSGQFLLRDGYARVAALVNAVPPLKQAA